MTAVSTRAAGRIARRAFTVAEVEAMQRKGIFHPDEKFELVEGEIVPMQARSPLHEMIKETLVQRMMRNLPPDLWIGIERTIFLSDKTALDPDVSLFRDADKARKIDGPSLLLAVEVSHSTLAYDRGLKARLYAIYGVPELWVIDVRKRQTLLHAGPVEDGTWSSIRTVGRDEPLTHPALPGLALVLADV